jgi:DNA-binding response OmpR family regulator
MMKIFIVEDDVMIADLLDDCLTEAGYEVCAVVSTATQAVTAAQLHHPQLAIIDVNLGSGGFGSSIPARLGLTWGMGILFASGTGYIDPQVYTGTTGLIVKPYSMTDMLSALAIISDIVTSGVSARAPPRGMRMLHGGH